MDKLLRHRVLRVTRGGLFLGVCELDLLARARRERVRAGDRLRPTRGGRRVHLSHARHAGGRPRPVWARRARLPHGGGHGAGLRDALFGHGPGRAVGRQLEEEPRVPVVLHVHGALPGPALRVPRARLWDQLPRRDRAHSIGLRDEGDWPRAVWGHPGGGGAVRGAHGQLRAGDQHPELRLLPPRLLPRRAHPRAPPHAAALPRGDAPGRGGELALEARPLGALRMHVRPQGAHLRPQRARHRAALHAHHRSGEVQSQSVDRRLRNPCNESCRGAHKQRGPGQAGAFGPVRERADALDKLGALGDRGPRRKAVRRPDRARGHGRGRRLA
mmetsp:Transcript_68557/g.155024  ORF Transcript_68557/g.155024 Transcript_68557/m.155024 type:complete len:329 (+) Transcript_68557:659-1645(+)